MELTPQEAIGAIKSNYPPSQYTVLRKALDMSMVALEENEKLKGKLAELELLTNRCCSNCFLEHPCMIREMHPITMCSFWEPERPREEGKHE